MRREVAFGVLGQLISSGTNFGLQLALIGFATKEDYGWYVLVMSYFYLGLGVQNAIVNTPLAVVLGKEPPKYRYKKVRLLSVWIYCSALLLGGVVGILSGDLLHGDISKSAAVGLAFTSFWVREFYRAAANSLGAIKKSALLDLVNAAFLGICFLWILTSKPVVRTSEVFLLVGFANCLTLLPWAFQFKPLWGGLSHHTDVARHARWSLPGVLVIWVQNNAYLSVAHMFWGPKLVADLGASRLWIVPLATAFSGWSRTFLSLASTWAAEKKFLEIKVQVSKAAWLVILFHTLLIGVFFLIANTALQQIVPVSYIGLESYTYTWLIFSLISLCRGIFTQGIQALGDFSSILGFSIISMVATGVMVAFAVIYMWPLLLILSLIFGEIIVLALARRHLLSRLDCCPSA